ncbi:MAG: Excinuclease ABC C subunit domain protein [Parcubacteria group bacterium GW2011_GWE2_39_37]|uniref:Excinuclease ABC C subunit domain protein n=1 Tax=Candidatus Falkowbacteria bacterium GW2011_GWF2_39_8 TaxID=1618642 RepID=A0A0G0PSR8_9BACT|nr:MAG: Excinuclease ABC C subunit domain protein [Parcubacteria group bacterium GW2011_GWE2_39_37]KKR31209.1 MAG: Excinuclease ABC C subunit domain protein [Candidatus Falkowbacteria bacterium GW2011_GWF2_39_8]
MRMKEYIFYVYIMSNRPNGALYVGVTNNLAQRVIEHKSKEMDGHAKKYEITQLVYFELFGDIGQALYREKQLKKWKREWKIKLIENDNKNWDDITNTLL